MAFEQRRVGRHKVRYNHTNADNNIVYPLIIDGAKVTPTSATTDIYRPGTSTAIDTSVSMTVSGTTVTLALDTTTIATYPVKQGYRLEMDIVHAGGTVRRHLMFDVVKYLLHLNVSFDQLVSMDDGIRGMLHDGDDDFSALIDMVRDILQMKIETKVIGDSQLIENMILDESKVAVPGLFLALSYIWNNKGDDDKRDWYMDQFDGMWRAVMSSIRYDTGQSGEEKSTIGGIQPIRLVL